MFPKFKIFPISNFSQIRYEGGSSNFEFFPNSKKSKTSWGRGGGQENCGLFPLFGTFFNSMAPLMTVKFKLYSLIGTWKLWSLFVIHLRPFLLGGFLSDHLLLNNLHKSEYLAPFPFSKHTKCRVLFGTLCSSESEMQPLTLKSFRILAQKLQVCKLPINLLILAGLPTNISVDKSANIYRCTVES